jgi:hypothetical protein
MFLIFLHRLITVADIKNSILFLISIVRKSIPKINFWYRLLIPAATKNIPTSVPIRSNFLRPIRSHEIAIYGLCVFTRHINNFIFLLSLYVCHASLAWTPAFAFLSDMRWLE